VTLHHLEHQTELAIQNILIAFKSNQTEALVHLLAKISKHNGGRKCPNSTQSILNSSKVWRHVESHMVQVAFQILRKQMSSEDVDALFVLN